MLYQCNNTIHNLLFLAVSSAASRMNSTILQGGRLGGGEKSNSFRQYLKMAKQMGLSKEELAQVSINKNSYSMHMSYIICVHLFSIFIKVFGFKADTSFEYGLSSITLEITTEIPSVLWLTIRRRMYGTL